MVFTIFDYFIYFVITKKTQCIFSLEYYFSFTHARATTHTYSLAFLICTY